MAAKKIRKLSPMNLAYGIGAAVVITGAMFKFLNWRYGDTLLFVGLTTEAIVFFISAFEMSKEYNWEKIFPQLASDDPTPLEQLEELVEKANVDPIIIERLTNSIERLEENVGKMAESSTSHVRLQEQLDRMRESSEKFQTEMSALNANISKMNEFYSKMLTVMGDKSQNS